MRSTTTRGVIDGVDRSLCLEAVASLGQLSEPLFRRWMSNHGVAVHDPDELWELRDALPPGLVDAIHRTFDVAEELGGDHRPVSTGGSPSIAEAVTLLLDDPPRFEVEHQRRAGQVMQDFQEFVGRDVALPYVDDARVAATQRRLRQAFGDRASPEVRAWLAPRAVQFLIRFHPRRCDLVVYYPRSGRLAVSAPDHLSTTTYVEAFGELLADDRGWFSSAPVVTLDPLLRGGRDALRPTPGVAEVRLVEVGLEVHNEWRERMVVRAEDAVPAVERRVGELRHVRMVLRVGAEWRSVTLEVPDRVAYDWRQDGEVVRDFLEERGFLASASPEPQCRAA